MVTSDWLFGTRMSRPQCILLINSMMSWEALCAREEDRSHLFAAVVCSGLLQKHLLPRLQLAQMLTLERTTTSLQHIVGFAHDAVWRASLLNTVPSEHVLARPAPTTGGAVQIPACTRY